MQAIAIVGGAISAAVVTKFVLTAITYLLQTRKNSQIPKPKDASLLTAISLWGFIDTNAALDKLKLSKKDVDFLPMLQLGLYLDGSHAIGLIHPEAIKEVLANEEIFAKHPSSYDTLKILGGNGLVTTTGELWKQQRKVLTPVFHFNAIKHMIVPMIEEIEEWLEQLQVLEGKSFPVREKFHELSTKTIIRVAFGGEFDKEWMIDQWRKVLKYFGWLFLATAILGRISGYLPFFYQLENSFALLRKRVREWIESRKEKDTGKEDMLAVMMNVIDEHNGGKIPDEVLIDQTITFLLAGQDTTATLLSWIVYFIAKNPDVQKKLQSEVDEVLQGNPISPEHLGKLKYTKQVIEETLRIRPPVWILDRKVTKDCEIMGQKIAQGTSLLLLLQAVHLNASEWENPQVFNPERFSEENKKVSKRHPYSFIPFSAGPRNCIGQKVSIQESTLALAMLMQRFDVTLDPTIPLHVNLSITQEPEFNAILTKRNL